MSESSIENQIIEELDQGDQSTEENIAELDRDVNKGNQIKETKKDLGKLKSKFLEKGPNGEYVYKLDAANNYLMGVGTSIKKIKEALFNDRKTIITAVQIALYKAGYLPEGQIDGKWGPITRGAVDKFQRENGLGKQKNPGYLNVNTLNKLVEVSTKKEEERQKETLEQNKKKPSKKRTEVKITPPKIDTVEPSDRTRVARRPQSRVEVMRSDKITTKDKSKQPEQKIERKKGGTVDEIRNDIVKNVGYFKERQSGDSRFLFNGVEDYPDQITVCGETYKYSGEGSDLNGLGFETYDGGWAFQLGNYVNGVFREGVRFYFDGEREIGEFDYVGDLKNGTRIDADGVQYKIDNYNEIE